MAAVMPLISQMTQSGVDVRISITSYRSKMDITYLYIWNIFFCVFNLRHLSSLYALNAVYAHHTQTNKT